MPFVKNECHGHYAKQILPHTEIVQKCHRYASNGYGPFCVYMCNFYLKCICIPALQLLYMDITDFGMHTFKYAIQTEQANKIRQHILQT